MITKSASRNNLRENSLPTVQITQLVANLPSLSALHSYEGKDMIWSAKAGHIISEYINSVQELKNTVRTAKIGDLLQLAKPGDTIQFDPVRPKLKSYAAYATRTKNKSYFDLSTSENSETDHIDKSGDVHVQRQLSELHQQNDEDDGSNSGSSEDSDPDETEDEKGVIYVRRSIDDDTESKSLEGQIADLTKVAREHDITLVCDPIVDEGETGTNFNRPGIQQVAALAEMGEISYLIVDDISRIGRSAPETLSFIAQLESDHEVTILTPTGGLDISQVEDLMQATMHSLIAHMSTQYRTRSSLRSKISNFVDDKDWKSWYRTVPIGYELSDDGWVEVCSEEVDVVDAMFDKFLETQSYAETARHLNTKYGETLGQNVTSHGVKDALQNTIYIGEPSINIDSDKIEDEDRVVRDPHLQLLGKEKYRSAQKVVEDISRRYSDSGDSPESLDPDTAAFRFGLFATTSTSPVLKVICPTCGEPMRCNGQRELDGSWSAHNYQCTDSECATQRKWPYFDEFREMKNISNPGEGSPASDSDSGSLDESQTA